jgi:hypothetical protein
MKLSRTLSLFVAAALLAACSKEQADPAPSGAGTPQAQTPASNSGAANPGAGAVPAAEVPPLPTLQEAAAAAAAEIDEANADAEFEKLMREVQGG